jgi:hypothetical protein
VKGFERIRLHKPAPAGPIFPESASGCDSRGELSKGSRFYRNDFMRLTIIAMAAVIIPAEFVADLQNQCLPLR